MKRPQSEILILEDETWLCKVLADCLGKGGYSAICASSAQAAIDLLDTKPGIDLIFIDLMLPDYNGLAFIYETLSHMDWQDKRFILMSNLAAFEVVEDSAIWEHLNVAGYLYKPAFEPDKMLKMVTAALL